MFLCDQVQLNSVARDYMNCVKQVEHHLVCGTVGGVCEWIETLIESCTDRILGQCLDKEVVLSLKKKQSESILKNRLMYSENCEESPRSERITVFMKINPLLNSKLYRKHFLSTKMLRLG